MSTHNFNSRKNSNVRMGGGHFQAKNSNGSGNGTYGLISLNRNVG
jgi:hypothetical protein